MRAHEHRTRAPSRWLFPIFGLGALVWFLVRVVPKPSRASYPCQRAAFPVASGFVAWLLGSIASVAAFRAARRSLTRRRLAAGFALLGAALAALWLSLGLSERQPLGAAQFGPNRPIGVARGLRPGRVAWVHDPAVTDWAGGTGEGNWWYQHIDAAVARSMVSRAIRGYAGIDDEEKAWEAIFRHFNREKGRGDVGYRRGEKIAIKINLVACWAGPGSDRVAANYEKAVAWRDNVDNTPEVLHALLYQLVHVVGAAQSDISIGDPTGWFPNYMYEKLHPDFPDVQYWDNRGTLGRTKAVYSDHPIYWSKPGLGTVRQDYVPAAYAEATYLVNCAILKSHDSGAITVCGKNHYGSLIRLPDGQYQDASGAWRSNPTNPPYYDWHADLPSRQPVTGRYRNRVDFMGHADIGGKTILYVIDGVIAGRNWEGIPEPWTLPPFDSSGGWPSSLFLSMDPVAIDSVALDFLLEEWPQHAGMSGADDYLVEAALADDPPSGTFYDPNHPGNVERIPSQGVHEHWNDPIEKRYSRDLDPDRGEGIELLLVEDDRDVLARASGTPRVDGTAEGLWRRTLARPLERALRPAGTPPAASDLSAAARFLWDEFALYVLLEVSDDRIARRAAPGDYADEVRVFVDADASRGRGAPPPNYDGLNDFDLRFAWGESAPETGPRSAPFAPAAVAAWGESAGGWVFEAAIPWSALRARPAGLGPVRPGARIALDLHVLDRDGAGELEPEAWIAWRSESEDADRDASLLAEVSLGRALPVAGTLLARGSPCKYRKGDASPPAGWRAADYDDAAWAEGALPIGYGDPPFGTQLLDMQNRYPSAFVRASFEVPADVAVTALSLSADYDDGFVAWVNGVEVARANAPTGEPAHDALATGNHESGSFERFALPPPEGYLRPGRNVLSVQGLNVSLSSSDFKLDLEITYTGLPAPSRTELFVRGDSNGDGSADIADAIHTLLALFAGGAPTDCEDARDLDDDGAVRLADSIRLLQFLFRGGEPPAAPYPVAGPDPTPDDLPCSRGL